MQTKSSVLKRKFETSQNSNFYYYVCFPASKALKASKFLRKVKQANLKILSVPSKFKLISDDSVQNPQIKIIYGEHFNFKQIAFVDELVAPSFTLKNKTYSSLLLKDTFSYRTSANVCTHFASSISNIPLLLSFLFFHNTNLKEFKT